MCPSYIALCFPFNDAPKHYIKKKKNTQKKNTTVMLQLGNEKTYVYVKA